MGAHTQLRQSMIKALMLLSVIFIACYIAACLCSARSHDLAATEKLVRGIQEQDDNAILEAGSSGNRIYVPYLKAALKHPHAEEQLIRALAKLGDKEQQQRIACTIHGTAASQVYETATERLPYIRGWFSIKA